MSDIDTLVENYFSSKTKTLTKEALYEIFEEVLEEAVEMTDDIYFSIVSANRQLDLFDKKNNLTYTKRKQMEKMSELSYKYYKEEIGPIFDYFPTGVTIEKPDNLEQLIRAAEDQLKESIADKTWEKMLDGVDNPILNLVSTPQEAYWITTALSKKRNDGEKREQGIVAYCNKIKPSENTKNIAMAGKDLMIEGVACEVKSSEKSDPNYQLNSSAVAPDPNKVYMFIVNSKTKPEIYLVSSEFMYKVITYRLVDEKSDDLEKSIKQNVENILGTVSLSDMVAQTILTGESYDTVKTFQVGKSAVNARFRIMFSLGKIE